MLSSSLLVMVCVFLQLSSIAAHVMPNKGVDRLHATNDSQNMVYINMDQNAKGPSSSDSLADLQQFRESLGKRMMAIVEAKADPCDDFYEYACGNWQKQYDDEDNGEPSAMFYIGLREDVTKRVEYILTSRSLKHKLRDTPKLPGLLNARNFYQTCMKENLFVEKPIAEYLQFVTQRIGFPAINAEWSPDKFNLSKAAGACSLITRNCLFNIKMSDSFPFCPILMPLEQFGVDNQMKLADFTDDYSSEYEMNKEIMKYLLHLYGVDDSKADKVVDDIMLLGHRLMEHSARGNLSEIAVRYILELPLMGKETFDWESFFLTLSQNDSLDDYFVMFFKNRQFFERFPTLMKPEDFETLSNYLALKVLAQLHSEQKWIGSHDLFCLSRTKIAFSFVIGDIYRMLYEDTSELDDLINIFEKLKQAQIDIINKSDYSAETKTKAAHKLNAINVSMGYLNDPVILELVSMIANTNFSGNYYANNLKEYLLRCKLRFHHYLSQVNHTVQPLTVLNPIIINASYNRFKNSVQINAVGLRPPMYEKRYPKSVIYGSVAQLMAHEIAHAFDKDSSQLGDSSDPIVAWSESDIGMYENRSQCFVQQYDAKYFPAIDRRINGTKTLCENMADNGGLQLAYTAYKSIVNQMTYNELTQEMLPHTSWTHMQTFFVAHAQKYCANSFRKQLIADVDSIYPFFNLRANVPLENLPDFAKVFDCPLGSRMNPVKKCTVF